MRPTSFFAAYVCAISAFLLGTPAAANDPCPDFEITGEGPDLILVPGLGSSPEVWDATIESLSSDYRIHLIHVAGFAGREPTGDPETLVQRTVQEIILRLECNKVETALYAGHSMGDFLGLKLASEHPDRIERLVVVDALPFYPLIFSPLATEEAARPQADGFRAQILSQDNAAFEASQRMGVRSLVKEAELQARVVRWSMASDRATFAGAIHTLMTTDLRSSLETIDTPTTVIVAANPFATRERMERLYATAYSQLKGAQISIIDDSYHFIMFDQPEAFEAAFRKALGEQAK